MYILYFDIFHWIIKVPKSEQNSHGLSEDTLMKGHYLQRVELRYCAQIPRDCQQPKVATILITKVKGEYSFRSQWELEPWKRGQTV